MRCGRPTHSRVRLCSGFATTAKRLLFYFILTPAIAFCFRGTQPQDRNCMLTAAPTGRISSWGKLHGGRLSNACTEPGCEATVLRNGRMRCGISTQVGTLVDATWGLVLLVVGFFGQAVGSFLPVR